jgi:ring-1,2-phenylacetyl-CoA epoxidase subunit PaaC
MKNNIFTYTLRIADDSLILGQRLSELCGHGPILEEDIATTNIALDLIGQATSLFEYAAILKTDLDVLPKLESADDLAFLRFDRQYVNLLLLEQPNGDFAQTIARSFFFDAFRIEFYAALMNSKDEQLAAIAEKSLKETKYHYKHSAEWMIRMGDGTEESNRRVNNAITALWKYTDELFFMDEVDTALIAEGIAVDLNSLKEAWLNRIQTVFAEATLTVPEPKSVHFKGRNGMHTEHLGYILAEMQYMQRAYPGMKW